MVVAALALVMASLIGCAESAERQAEMARFRQRTKTFVETWPSTGANDFARPVMEEFASSGEIDLDEHSAGLLLGTIIADGKAVDENRGERVEFHRERREILRFIIDRAYW
jgi:hypothetical protein